MTPSEFLHAVWPETGYYCVASPFVLKDKKVSTYAHKVFSTIDEAAAFIEKEKNKVDIFFAVHTLKEEKVWNPHKFNYKTNEPGAFEVRVQRNSKEAKCLFFDIDIGQSEDKYSSQQEGMQALKEFCEQVKLPRPMVVSSGGGLHVYWLFKESFGSEPWRSLANDLKRLALHLKLKIDVSRTVDSSSVLRVAGTFNLKKKDNPRPVKVLTTCTPRPVLEYERLIRDAIIKFDPLPSAPPKIQKKDSIADELGDNTQDYYTQIKPTIVAVGKACPQLKHVFKKNGKSSYQEWYHCLLQSSRFIENGHHWAHELSKGDERYSPEVTDRHLNYLESNKIGPTLCSKIALICGPDKCNGCEFKGKVKTPIAAARFVDPLPTPDTKVQAETGEMIETTDRFIDPPEPYRRNKHGIVAEITDKEGETYTQHIYGVAGQDLYPVYRVEGYNREQHLWRCVLPLGVTREFTLDADALYSKEKLFSALAHQGIYANTNSTKELQDYMIAYIQELQKAQIAQQQRLRLGWYKEFAEFVTPEGAIQPDGSLVTVAFTGNLRVAVASLKKKGTLEDQIKLMEFYNHPEYLAHQFFICAGLGAILMAATGHHGAVINASGDSGASKTTALWTAASLWGDPEHYPLNGTKSGSTIKAKNARVAAVGNYPVFVDEITHIQAEEAHDMVMHITQPNSDRDQLYASGDLKERNMITDSRSTLMLTTANSSLHNILSTQNTSGTAGSMRVIEIIFEAQKIHTKTQADEYLRNLRENHGHIGPEFAKHVVKTREASWKRVHQMMASIDTKANVEGCERFWSGGGAVSVVAAQMAKELGLLPFDPQQIEDWYLKRQLQIMRSVVSTEYNSSLEMFVEYLYSIHGQTIYVRSVPGDNLGSKNVLSKHYHGVVAHYDLDLQEIWVSIPAFQAYCKSKKLNSSKIKHDLTRLKPSPQTGKLAPNVLKKVKDDRRTIGLDTEYSMGQSRCLIVDMTHPDLTGRVSDEPHLPSTDLVEGGD